MYDRLVFLPLAQTNTTQSVAPAVEPRVAITTAPAVGPPAGGVTTAPEATTTTTASAPIADTQKAPTGIFGSLGSLLPIILMFVVLYFVLIRGQRKEEKRRKGLIAELKKGDKVMTVGGLIARVVQVDGDEVVLKVDESANVKATYQKASIQQVLTDEKKS